MSTMACSVDTPVMHKGDWGTPIVVTIKECDENGVLQIVPLQTAIDLTLFLRKPDGTVLTKVATLYTDGTDGKLVYTTIDGDIDDDGTWEVEAAIEFTTAKWYADVDTFPVLPTLEPPA